jgi:hypothetical protein
MHKARGFFYACAGLFLLVAVYFLSAKAASGQTGGVAEVAEVAAGGRDYLAVSGRLLYSAELLDYGGGLRGHRVQPPVPGTSRIVAASRASYDTYAVMLEDGDCYQTTLDGTAWTLTGNVFGGPTPVQKSTFGSVKARYR